MGNGFSERSANTEGAIRGRQVLHESLRKNLVRETKWSRTYQPQPGFLAFESKFEADGLTVSVEDLSSQWDSWSESDRLDFANAFIQKAHVTRTDEEAMDFLVAKGDEQVWSTIALYLTRHSNKGMVLDFLLERLVTPLGPKGNFIQALYVLGDKRAVPTLHQLHDRLSEQVRSPQGEADRWTVYDFLICCEALVYFGGSHRYQDEIRSFLMHPDERIRNQAQHALEGPQPEEFYQPGK
jgi:hypothetical protein